MIQTLKTVAMAFAAIFAGAVVSAIPPLPAWFDAVDAHQGQWMVILGGAALLGLLLMMGGILRLIIDRGTPLSHEQAEDVERSVRMAAQPVTWRTTAYKVLGTAQGRAAYDEFSFRAMKEAWKNGAWRIDPVWRRRYLTALGAALMAVGLFGGSFVLGAPPVKVLTGGALLYATVMISRGFWKA